MITIVETISGYSERRVYRVYRGAKFPGQWSDLSQALKMHPGAKVDYLV